MLLIVNVNIKFYGPEAFITIKHLSIYILLLFYGVGEFGILGEGKSLPQEIAGNSTAHIQTSVCVKFIHKMRAECIRMSILYKRNAFQV